MICFKNFKALLLPVALMLSQMLSALTMDDVNEYREIAKLFDDKKYDAAIARCEAAAKKPNPFAVLSLFYIHRYGLYNRPVNTAAAEKYRKIFGNGTDCEYDSFPYRSPLTDRRGKPLPGGQHPIGDCYAAAMECKSEMCGRVADRVAILVYDPQFEKLLHQYALERNCWSAYTSDANVNQFGNNLTRQQLETLRRASEAGYVPATVNLALALFTHQNNQFRDAVAARRHLDQALAVFQSYLQKKCFHAADSREYRTAVDLDALIPRLEQKSTAELLAEYRDMRTPNSFIRLAYTDILAKRNDHPSCQFFVAKQYLDQDYDGAVKLIKEAADDGSDEALCFMVNEYRDRSRDKDSWYYYYLAGTKNYKLGDNMDCYECALRYLNWSRNAVGLEAYKSGLAKLAQVYEPARKQYEETLKQYQDISGDIEITVSNPDTVRAQMIQADGHPAVKCVFPPSATRNFVELKIPPQPQSEQCKVSFDYRPEVKPSQMRIIATFPKLAGSNNKLEPSLSYFERPLTLRLMCFPTSDSIEITIGLP